MTDQEAHLSVSDAPVPGAEMTWGAKVELLRKMAISLLKEIEKLGRVHNLDIEHGFDFYEEVRRFEIDIINCALKSTRGHQRQAAGLLGLNTSTLSTKLKQYGITIERSPNFATDENELAFTIADGESQREANSEVVR